MQENFNLSLLRNYNSHNPYIKTLRNKYMSIVNHTFTKEELEYLSRNFRYKPYEFNTVSLKIGEESKKLIQKQYNRENVNNEVKINILFGEIKEKYHVGYKNSNRVYDYWIMKEEVPNIYEYIYGQYPISLEETGDNFKYELYQHQFYGAKFLLHQQKCFLMDTTGAGKTHTAIAASQSANKVLIICIFGKELDWKKELLTWGYESKIIKTRKKGGWDYSDKKYTIISNHILKDYNETKSKKIPEPNKDLLLDDYDCIIVDEAQYFKNSSAKKVKAIKPLIEASNLKYIWLLSATMVEKNEELYKICVNFGINITDVIYTSNDKHYLEWFPKWEEFLSIYCNKVKITPKNGKRPFWVQAKKGVYNSNTIELAQRIKHKIQRKRTEEVIPNFPDKHQHRLYFELTPKEKTKYDILFEEYVSKVEKSLRENKKQIIITEEYIMNTIANLVDSESLVSQSLMRQFLAIKKIPHTIQFIKNEIKEGNNIIIFTSFKEEYKILKQKLSKYAICVDSGLSASVKHGLIEEYMTSEKPILIGNNKSIGTGLNIQKADVIYFNSIPWESDIVEQAIGRAYRQGRKDDVYVYFPLFDETVDENVYSKVLTKKTNRHLLHDEKIDNLAGELTKEDKKETDNNEAKEKYETLDFEWEDF